MNPCSPKIIGEKTYIVVNCRWAWDQSPVWHNSAPSNWCCCHCKRFQWNAVALWWPLLDSGIYCDMPGCKTRKNPFSISQSNWISFERTCKHSDVRAFPQQSSPFSCLVKHSNRLCSSLRRHPFHVSRALLDVAHVFWHFGVTASEQHNRPDHSEPWAIAVIGRERKKNCYKNHLIIPNSKMASPIEWSLLFLLVKYLPRSVWFMQLQKFVSIDGQFRFTSAMRTSFPLKFVAKFTSDNCKIVWGKYLIEILRFILIHRQRVVNHVHMKCSSFDLFCLALVDGGRAPKQ